jgi:deazaflavin-dependent oxidoreductase (nitroreductase family)
VREMAERYERPGWAATNILNRVVATLTRLGFSVQGARVLAVRGRSSGEWRTTPVNLLNLDGSRYLVSPRGVTQWARNVRAGGEAELRLGRRRQRVRLLEIPDDEKPPVLRAYLQRWKKQVGRFFQGVGPDAPDADLRRIAAGYPVFRVLPPR